ncbi:uncharacterized protein BO96DRAFT_185268 [Aspergillus niger CBS 101883]|uniref:uncharacterized protein n=1 Tax=Aspergillus lacticoffeatus (strain CBS 101883) TaxID=1450533 RepID=UPI000D7FE82D|nr:uncharacterized protein BO96DRAFT_185268 [Aspergillus niger CBS 101883]PYH60225.1 hypothetical protein BO96DRAFT_185268 [Aspergillus niger CBS 101883]
MYSSALFIAVNEKGPRLSLRKCVCRICNPSMQVGPAYETSRIACLLKKLSLAAIRNPTSLSFLLTLVLFEFNSCESL